MPKVSDEHRAAQRQRILDAAIAVIQRKGLSSTTMSDIIKESGLSAGAIYGYWKGKDDLIRDIAASVVTTKSEILVTFADQSPVPPPATALAQVLRNLPHEWIESGLVLQFWGNLTTGNALSAGLLDHAATLMERVTGYLEAWCRQEGLPLRRAARLAPAFVALIQGYVMQASFRIATDLDDYTQSATGLLEGQLAS
ncbi:MULTISPECIES: TetR/AcrR family transcriptional regulator [unclassified Luteococcus]|uniref:TetR/AcrR family transcriptional regulator n=1 Tax=unclassified Luteococcus TaxID=2639923 RepID=UPI00313ADFBF